MAQLSGTYTLPGTVGGTTVNNLTDLANLLSTSTVNSTAIFEFTSSYTDASESYPVTFTPFMGSGKVIIRPASSVTATLTTAGMPGTNALIDLYGIENITFDGRPGGTGSTSEWLFENTESSSSYPAFRFVNGASYNTLQYLVIEASTTNYVGPGSTAPVLFSTSTAGGNSHNVIQYCNIGPYSASPYNGIYSYGSVGAENASNSLLYNNIYNIQGYFSQAPYGAINIGPVGNGDNWNITGNSIYDTYITGFYGVNGLVFNPGDSSKNNVISGNYIGGSAPKCGGTPFLFAGANSIPAPDFNAIYINAVSATVSNNTIQNIKSSHEYYSQTMVGINLAGGTTIVEGNTIGSDSVANSFHNESMGVTIGIWNESPDSVTIDGNIIANITLDDSTQPQFGSTYGMLSGIYCSTVEGEGQLGACKIINNQVHNLSSIIAYNINQYYPLNTGGGTTSRSLVNNEGAMAGIYLQNTSATNNVISKNTVHDIFLNTTGGSDPAYIYGIADIEDGGTTTINGNLVYGIWAPDSYGGSGAYLEITGVYLAPSVTGTLNVFNNMVDLGTKPTDGTGVQNTTFAGIWDNSTDNNVKLKLYILHNSVYIGGTDNNTENNNLSSYAFTRNLDYGSSVYDSVLLVNNIFENNRSTTSGTGENYGIYLNATTDVNDNYNDVYGAGNHFTFGNVGGTDYANLAAFKTANSGHEANTITGNPQFKNDTALTPDLHIINIPSVSPIDQAGTATATLVYDFDSLFRADYSPVDIGAAVDCSTSSGTASVTLAVLHDTLCNSSTADTFTATPVNGGTAPTYNFYVNGSSVQNGASNKYIANNLQNNESVYVVITSSAACLTSQTATSNSVVITVLNTTLVPQVSLAASGNNICAGVPVTFTATPVNGGSSPQYSFYINGVLKQVGANSIYTSSALNNNDTVKVVLTSDAACASPTTATSVPIIMVINPAVTPQVSVSPSANNVCSGTSITFTAAPTNPGTAPKYNFYVDGTLTQSGASATYVSTTLKNNDSVWVVMISNAPCASPSDTVTSIRVYMVITPKVQPSVALSASETTICPNSSVTFTATAVNGGNAPVYNFFLNKTSVQDGAGNTYISSSLKNGDSVYVVLTSNAACDSPTTANSQEVHISVTSAQTPKATIAASQNNVCSGTSVTFTAGTTNGGDTISYNFFVNGVSEQNGSGTTYTTADLNNGDEVWVVSNNTGGCLAVNAVNSDTVVMTINPNVTPQVSITPSSNPICYGSPVIFTANPVNGGSSPSYSFYKNGAMVQNGASATYSTDSLHNNDSVWVVLTSNANCATAATATSAKVYMSINAKVQPTVNLTASHTSICPNTSVTFTASSGNAGNASTYNFYLNGVSVQNGALASYITSAPTLHNNDSVYAIITSTAACDSPATARSNTIIITVSSAATPITSIYAGNNSTCQGSLDTITASTLNGGDTITYNFFVNGVSRQNGSLASYINGNLNNGDKVWAVSTNSGGCLATPTAYSDTLTINVLSNVAPTVVLTASQNPTCTGATVTFTTTATNQGSNPVYDFYLDNVPVQNGSSDSYSNNSLADGDLVQVIMTSNAPCASPASATSNAITISVNGSLTTTASLSTPADSICIGSSAVLTASATNAGNSANYNFYVSGASVQSGTSTTYTTNNLNNNVSVWVVVTSSLSCATQGPVYSDTLQIAVATPVTPAVTLTSSVNNVCAGIPIVFTANGINAGSGGIYNFFVNNNAVQSGTSLTYTSSGLNNGDQVWAELESSAVCATPPNVYSDTINDSIYPLGISTINHNLCTGSTYLFNGVSLDRSGTYYDTLTTIHGCDSIITLNLNLAFPASSEYSDSICLGDAYIFNGTTLYLSGIYYDTLSTFAGCDSFVELTLVVLPKPSPVIHQNGTTLSVDSFTNYQWLLNGNAITGATQSSYIYTEPGFYSIAVVGIGGCTDTSGGVNITGVNDPAQSISLQLYPNPTQDVLMIKMQSIQSQHVTFNLYDLAGKLVLSNTSDVFRSAYDGSLNLSDCASGFYFLRIEAGDVNLVRKVEVVK
jgi:hypothetical protein